jgi:hypothetical protein
MKESSLKKILTFSPESSFPAKDLSSVVFPDPGDPNSKVILHERKKLLVYQPIEKIDDQLLV